MNTRIPSVALLLAALEATSCSHAQGVQREPLPPSLHYVEQVQRTRVEGHSERLQALMSEHFGFVAWARDATSIGDIDAAREALLDLANMNDDVVPGAWLPRVRALKEDARAVARSTSLDELANGVAQLGRACGDCHRATGGGPDASTLQPPAADDGPDTFPDRMFKHRQAIEGLWMGLVAPSNQAWGYGAAELAKTSDEVQFEGGLPWSYAKAFHNLKWLGWRALLGGTSLDRAESYGRILGACAGCHTRSAPSL